MATVHSALPPFAPSLAAEPRTVIDLRVSAEVVQLSALLAMPLPDLEGAVAKELDENPALEARPVRRCMTCARPVRGRCLCRGSGSGRAVDLAVDPSATSAGLLADCATDLTPTQRRIAAFVLGDLDDRGLLDRPLSEVARDLGVTTEAVTATLDVLRTAGPVALGAADVHECLTRQAEMLDLDHGLVAHLLRRLDDLAHRRWARLAAEAGASATEVREAAATIARRLRPYVSVPVSTPSTPPSPPDIELVLTDHVASAEVLDDPGAALRTDALWRRVADGTYDVTAVERREAQQWVTRADTFRRVLDRRRSTLELVATGAACRQVAYLREGPRAHRPLTRGELAAELGVHESTVSRAVKDKVVLAPDGRVLPLADLFGASTSVIDALRELLDAPAAPTSDRALADALEQRGYRIARRTVTKYRLQLGIAAGATR